MLDESVHLGLADHLASLGHDATAVGRDYPRSLVDEVVLATAHREGRIVITYDRDFGELVFERVQPHSGVSLLRLKGLPFEARAARLDPILADHADHADDLHRFLVVTQTTVRVR